MTYACTDAPSVLEACQQGICCCVVPDDTDKQHCSVSSVRLLMRGMLTGMLQQMVSSLGNVSADASGQMLHMSQNRTPSQQVSCCMGLHTARGR
jgi:hypothetical protein